ncbi:MAG: hypothetical protein JXQ66_07835 [Campylobacterales bacterium]|nr:hypothetical protein [Campylobacterales bacterium]
MFDGIDTTSVSFVMNVLPHTKDNILTNGESSNGVTFASNGNETLAFDSKDNYLDGYPTDFYTTVNGGDTEAMVTTTNDYEGIFIYTDATGTSYKGDFATAISSVIIDLTEIVNFDDSISFDDNTTTGDDDTDCKYDPALDGYYDSDFNECSEAPKVPELDNTTPSEDDDTDCKYDPALDGYYDSNFNECSI